MSIYLRSGKHDGGVAYVALALKDFNWDFLKLGSVDRYLCTWYIWYLLSPQLCLRNWLCKLVLVLHVIMPLPQGLGESKSGQILAIVSIRCNNIP